MSTKKTRLAIRGWKRGKLFFEERYEATAAELEDIAARAAERHAHAFVENGEVAPHMLEFEWLDEANPLQRFMRFGSDPSAMVQPGVIDDSLELLADLLPLPSHCGACGVPLRGGATKHSSECPWTRLIDEHFPEAKRTVQ